MPAVTLDRENKALLEALDKAATVKDKKHKITGELYQRGNIPVDVTNINKQLLKEGSEVMFKGKLVIRKVIQEVMPQIDMSDYHDVIHDGLLEKTLNMIENKLKQFVQNGEVQ